MVESSLTAHVAYGHTSDTSVCLPLSAVRILVDELAPQACCRGLDCVALVIGLTRKLGSS